jgi:hypothetical protein
LRFDTEKKGVDKMKLYVLLFAFTLGFVFQIKASIRNRVSDTINSCHRFIKNNIEGEACVSYPVNWNKKDIVFNLHGSGGDARSWEHDKDFQKAMSIMEKAQIPRPLVVSISFGQWWILKDFGSQDRPALLEIYLQLQKEIEALIFDGGRPRRRILIGESMGSYNSLLLLAKSDLNFDKAAILCPGFAIIGPYSSQEEIQNYLDRNKPYIVEKAIYEVLGLLKMEFPTIELWNRHAPFQVVENLKLRKTTEFHVLGNTQDEYGFGEGARLLKDELLKMNLNVKYEVVKGSHCVLNPASIANFLK